MWDELLETTIFHIKLRKLCNHGCGSPPLCTTFLATEVFIAQQHFGLFFFR
jgi:hypothetical protein